MANLSSFYMATVCLTLCRHISKNLNKSQGEIRKTTAFTFQFTFYQSIFKWIMFFPPVIFHKKNAKKVKSFLTRHIKVVSDCTKYDRMVLHQDRTAFSSAGRATVVYFYPPFATSCFQTYCSSVTNRKHRNLILRQAVFLALWDTTQ